MNIKALRIFVSLMENTTLARASDKLNISQPAASRLVRILEEEIGEILFSRTRQRLRPTQEAATFLPEATRILNTIDDIPAVFKRSRAKTGIPLRILCMPRIVNSLVVPVLAELHALDPTQKYKVEVCPRREFGRRLLHGKYDVGVSSQPSPMDSLQTHFLARVPLTVMLPKDHHLSQSPFLTPEDLINERYIALDKHTVIRLTVDEALSDHGFDFEITHEVSSSDVAHQFVCNGMGYTFADAAAVTPEILNRVALIPCFLKPEIEITYFLPEGWRPHDKRNLFLDLLRTACKNKYAEATVRA